MTKKLYRLSRNTIRADGVTEIGEVEVKPSPNGYVTRSNSRVKNLDEPFVTCKIIVYSETKNTKRLDRLCAKIRKAVEEYGGNHEKEC